MTDKTNHDDHVDGIDYERLRMLNRRIAEAEAAMNGMPKPTFLPEGETDKLLRVEEVAEQSEVSEKTVERAMSAGELEYVELAGRGSRRVRLSAMYAWWEKKAK